MPNRASGGIPEARPASVDKLPLRFSFKHLDLENKRFHHSKCCLRYFLGLFKTLQRFSNGNVEDFTDQNNQEGRHMIYFPDTCEPAGFENIPNVDAEQFGYQEGWQIGIYSENEWERRC